MNRPLNSHASAFLTKVKEAITRARTGIDVRELDCLHKVLTENEVQTVRDTVLAHRMSTDQAIDLIGTGCPPDRLAEADQLAQATGSWSQVTIWVMDGQLDDAIAAMNEGRLDEMYPHRM